MKTYTVTVARNMSADPDKTDGKAVGEVIELREGDWSESYTSYPDMCDIYYWRTTDLSDENAKTIQYALSSPHYSEETPSVIIYPKTIVSLNCFNQNDIDKLEVRGPITEKLGGTITFDSFTFTEV